MKKFNYNVEFCNDARDETERTSFAEEEKEYKTRATLEEYIRLWSMSILLFESMLFTRLCPILVRFFDFSARMEKLGAKGSKKATHLHEQDTQRTKF